MQYLTDFLGNQVLAMCGETAREVSNKKKEFIDLNDLMKVIVTHPPEFNDAKLEFYNP